MYKEVDLEKLTRRVYSIFNFATQDEGDTRLFEFARFTACYIKNHHPTIAGLGDEDFTDYLLAEFEVLKREFDIESGTLN